MAPDPPPDPAELRRVLVLGLGVTGRAVTSALLRRGVDVVIVDDHPTEATSAAARSLAVDLLVEPADAELDAALASVDVVVPSPGVPDRHPVFALAARRGVPVRSEFDLAARWDDRPIVAITGTDGKTTVTTMVAAMLDGSGIATAACGNTDVPLVEALDDPATQVFVVEASSFRLGHTHRFRPAVATWLNFAPDHLDVHASLEAYEAAKARIWADLGPEAVAVVNADDRTVARHRPGSGRVVTFGLGAGPGAPGPGTGSPDATVVDGVLVAPDGEALVPVADLPRAAPHDLANALAASVTAMAAGADVEAVRHVLRTFPGLPHRVELVGEATGVRWYDDSKATTPHAALAALAGFDSVVLLAGGRNKGLDLTPLGSAVPPVRAVVAIGESADEVAVAFAGKVPVVTVRTDMADAVASAARLVAPGDAVVLSPGCTSFDWFGSYAERGDAFALEVQRLRAGIEGS
jgi:UDP-N-acetylmuramoylalanine--D-glutamate ligase